MNKHSQDGKGLLAARKEFDRWVERVYNENVFDGTDLKATTEAVRIMRSTMNEALTTRIPTAFQLLRNQHLMYTAATDLLPKAAQEATTSLGRLVQNIRVHMPTTPLALGATVGYTAGLPLPVLIGGALAIPTAVFGAKAGKHILYNRSVRNLQGQATYTLRNLLDLTNQTIKKVSQEQGTGELVRQLKADRGILMSVIKQTEQWDKEVEQ